jgi:hypothetical protein
MKRFALPFATLLLLVPACDEAKDAKQEPKKEAAKPEAPGTVITDGQGNTQISDGQSKVVADEKGNAIMTDGKGNEVKADASGAIEAKSADGTTVKVDKDGNVQIDGVKLD